MMLQLLYDGDSTNEERFLIFLEQNNEEIRIAGLESIYHAHDNGLPEAESVEIIPNDYEKYGVIRITIHKKDWKQWLMENKSWFIKNEYYEAIRDIDSLIEKLS